MNILGRKTKDSGDKHRTELIVCGLIIAAIAATKAAHVYHKNICTKWALHGLVMGFHGAIDWFDEEFSDLKLKKLYDSWAKAHPEEILYI